MQVADANKSRTIESVEKLYMCVVSTCVRIKNATLLCLTESGNFHIGALGPNNNSNVCFNFLVRTAPLQAVHFVNRSQFRSCMATRMQVHGNCIALSVRSNHPPWLLQPFRALLRAVLIDGLTPFAHQPCGSRIASFKRTQIPPNDSKSCLALPAYRKHTIGCEAVQPRRNCTTVLLMERKSKVCNLEQGSRPVRCWQGRYTCTYAATI